MLGARAMHRRTRGQRTGSVSLGHDYDDGCRHHHHHYHGGYDDDDVTACHHHHRGCYDDDDNIVVRVRRAARHVRIVWRLLPSSHRHVPTRLRAYPRRHVPPWLRVRVLQRVWRFGDQYRRRSRAHVACHDGSAIYTHHHHHCTYHYYHRRRHHHYHGNHCCHGRDDYGDCDDY